MMKVDTFADKQDVVCRVNCRLEDQRQKLFYKKSDHWGNTRPSAF